VHEHSPLTLRPDANGSVTLRQRLRFHLARFFFEDRIGRPEKRTREAELSPETVDSAGR
jgi:hypothetical protein